MTGHGFKTMNEYARALGAVYEDTPKAVFAAVAFSYAARLTGDTSEAAAVREFLHEWRILHENGIVPQEPRKERTRTKAGHDKGGDGNG